MTDCPRFQLCRHSPEEAYTHYHGAPLVRATLRLVDWWLARRENLRTCRAERRAARVSKAHGRFPFFIQ